MIIIPVVITVIIIILVSHIKDDKKPQLYFSLQVQVSIIAGKTSGVSRHTLQINVNHTLLDLLANMKFSDLDFFKKNIFSIGPDTGTLVYDGRLHAYSDSTGKILKILFDPLQFF